MPTHTYFVDDIIDSRATKRSKQSGGKLFWIKWTSGETTWEPLEVLIDDKSYVEDLRVIFDEYMKVAREFPYKRRCCITCNRRVHNGKLFCPRAHCSKYCGYVGTMLQNV